MTATYRFDPVSRIHWLQFSEGEHPDEATRQLLKDNGWRFKGYRKQWMTNRRWVKVPDGIPYEDGGQCDYSEERAERLETAAEHTEARADAYSERARAMVSMIPFGQPIHGSTDRNRRERSWNTMGKAVREREKARWLEEKAEGSKTRHAWHHDPGVIARRLEKARKELADYEGYISRAQAREAEQGPLDERYAGYVVEYERRVGLLREQINRDEAELRAAGGLPADRVKIEKGDIILIGGHIQKVKRPNKKTFTCESLSLFLTSGKPWELQLDRTQFRIRIYTAAEWAELEKGGQATEETARAKLREVLAQAGGEDGQEEEE